VVATELAYQQNADVFGTVEDLTAHKAKLAELEAKRAELYAKFPSSRVHGDLHIGRITSDGAALITFRLAPAEVPVLPPETAGQRLVEYLRRPARDGGLAILEVRRVDAIYSPSIGMPPHAK